MQKTPYSTLYTYIPAEENTICYSKIKDKSVRLPDQPLVSKPDHRTTVLEQIQRTTTHKWLTDYLFSKALKLHGREWADVVVDRISRMNGRIRDKGAYFNWCITTKTIPNSEELRVQETKEKRKKFDEEKAENERLRIEKMIADREKSDPEIAKKAVAEFLSIISEVDKK